MSKDPLSLQFSDLPGWELIAKGREDLTANIFSPEALLLLVAAPRLESLGIAIPHIRSTRPFEHELYELLESRYGADAHSRYNALLRRVVSFARAAERGLQG